MINFVYLCSERVTYIAGTNEIAISECAAYGTLDGHEVVFDNPSLDSKGFVL